MSCLLRHPSALEVGARRVSWFLELLNHKENQAEIVSAVAYRHQSGRTFCWAIRGLNPRRLTKKDRKSVV